MHNDTNSDSRLTKPYPMTDSFGERKLNPNGWQKIFFWGFPEGGAKIVAAAVQLQQTREGIFKVIEVPPWQKQVTFRAILASFFPNLVFNFIVCKLNLTTGAIPLLNVAAGLLVFAILKTWTAVAGKVGLLKQPFSRQENTVIQTCVVASSGIIAFSNESVELEEDLGSPGISSIRSSCEDENNGDSDFVYISEILRAFSYAPEEADGIFLLLEKRQYLKGEDTSKVSRLRRKLIFETITEILDRKRQLPTWKAFAKYTAKPPSLQEIWSEFRKIREPETSDDLFEIVCGVLKKDLAGDATEDWVDCPVEMSEAVLDIERLIFKDLVGESIRDLAEFACKSTFLAPRRKLVF